MDKSTFSEADALWRAFALTAPDDPQASLLASALRALIIRHPFLRFGRLGDVEFPAEFTARLSELSRAAGLEPPDEQLEGMTVWGAVVPVQARLTVVLRPELVPLYLGDGPSRRCALQIVMHELCHVHDLSMRWGFQVEGELRLARTMWAEYFAQRYSYHMGADVEVDWQRLHYVLEGGCVAPSRTRTVTVARAVGYAWGSVHAAEETLLDLQPRLHRQLVQQGRFSAWLETGRTLRMLTDRGEAWRDAQGLRPLVASIRRWSL